MKDIYLGMIFLLVALLSLLLFLYVPYFGIIVGVLILAWAIGFVFRTYFYGVK